MPKVDEITGDLKFEERVVKELDRATLRVSISRSGNFHGSRLRVSR